MVDKGKQRNGSMTEKPVAVAYNVQAKAFVFAQEYLHNCCSHYSKYHVHGIAL
jgi:hypothetical protein